MTATLQAPTPVHSGPPRDNGPRKFRPDIEGLRAVAVVLVVFSHSGLALSGGYVGVDVFFVISGFLITRQLATEFTARNRISFAGFYARRARRILPAATVVIVATLLASWRWESPLRVRSVSIDGLYSAFSGINYHLATGGTNYFQAAGPPSPFQHYWSLAVEEQFYIVWPALLMIVGLVAGRRFGRRRSLVWALLAILAASLYLSVHTTGSSPSWAYFGAQTRVWELALGALVAITIGVWTRMPPALASQMSWLGLAMIALAAFMFTSSTRYPGAAVALPVFGSAMVIMGGCPGWAHGAEAVLKRRPMQFLGRTSYAWYLWHWPVLVIVPLALGHDLSTTQTWLAIVGSLLLAVATFYLVEQPIRSMRAIVDVPWRGLLLGASLIAASVATALYVANAVVVPGGTGEAVPVAVAAPKKAVTPDAMARLVAAGVSLKALPRVRPALASAENDHPNTHGCFSSYASTAPLPDRACTLGDPGASRTIVMIGDSHANAWSPAVDDFAKTHQWKYILYAKAACPPGVYVENINPLTHRLYKECDQWRTAVFARIRALHPAVVLVTSQIRTLSIDPAGMVASIRVFQAAGARVVYLEDTPFAGKVGSIPECLAAHSKDIQRCSLERGDPQTRLDAMLQRNLESSAAKKAGAILIDPTPWFCTATTCPPVINDMIVYSDNSHTTATYATWLSPELGRALQQVVG